MGIKQLVVDQPPGRSPGNLSPRPKFSAPAGGAQPVAQSPVIDRAASLNRITIRDPGRGRPLEVSGSKREPINSVGGTNEGEAAKAPPPAPPTQLDLAATARLRARPMPHPELLLPPPIPADAWLPDELKVKIATWNATRGELLGQVSSWQARRARLPNLAMSGAVPLLDLRREKRACSDGIIAACANAVQLLAERSALMLARIAAAKDRIAALEGEAEDIKAAVIKKVSKGGLSHLLAEAIAKDEQLQSIAREVEALQPVARLMSDWIDERKQYGNTPPGHEDCRAACVALAAHEALNC